MIKSKSKTKRKTFKYNDDYFEFYEKMKDKVKILEIDTRNEKATKIKYEEVE